MSKSSLYPANWLTLLSASRLLIGIFVLFALSGCGYHINANQSVLLPAGCTDLFLSRVINPSTETWLEPLVRRAIRDELTRRGEVHWVTREKAQSTVTVEVLDYSEAALIEGQDEQTLKSSAQITLIVRFFSAGSNTLLWTSGPVHSIESYRSEAGKREASRQAVQMAMRKVVDRMGQNF